MDRLEPFEVTVPANTPSSAPVTTSLPFADGNVDRLQVVFPPGPSGRVGFQMRHLGGQVIPYTGNVFIRGDNETLTWDLHNFPQASGWQIFAFNTDVVDHLIILRFEVTEIATNTARYPALTPVGA